MIGKMMELELSATILAIALMAGAILLLMITMLGAQREAPPSDSAAQHSTGPVFLFDGQELIDCNSAARVILGHSNIQGSDWQKLLAFLKNLLSSRAILNLHPMLRVSSTTSRGLAEMTCINIY
jgi:hypothetical protein